MEKMVFKKSYVFPILFGFWLPLTVLITYTVSVLTDHVTPILPYISDTGTWAPESCIFGIMLTLGALILIIIIYIRYRQVGEIHEENNFCLKIRHWNQWSFYSGIASVFGCLVVANFQVRFTLIVHLLGAGICFGFGTIYQLFQVIISFKIYPITGKRNVNILRAVLTAISAISLLVTSLSALISFINFEGKDMTKWTQKDGGYDYHLVSAAAEYVLSTATVLFILTFAQEFRSIEIHQPKITVKT